MAHLHRIGYMKKNDETSKEQGIISGTLRRLGTDEAAVEKNVIELFRSLPEGYEVLTNVSIREDHGGGRADVVVISPAGAVSVVEFRCQKGRVTGSRHAETLFLETDNLLSRERTMNNPVREAGRCVEYIQKRMEEKKIRAWVRGYVLFAHPETIVKLNGQDDIEVYSWDEREQLLSEILDCEGAREPLFRKERIMFALRWVKNKAAV